MPRIAGRWKKQDETNWLILDSLIRRGSQNSPSLENKKGKKILSHASVRIGIQLLQKRYLISVINIDNSIPKRPIKTFDATTLGILVWFVKNVQDSKKKQLKSYYFRYVRDLLPIISKKWESLKKFYEEEYLIKLLAKVISNMELLADDPFTLKYKTFYRGVTMEFKNTQEQKVFRTILELVDSDEFKKGFETMLDFAFFLEIYKLYDGDGHYDYDDTVGIKGKPHEGDWIRIIKSEKILQEQILTGFKTMKKYSEKTDSGLQSDIELILGKGMDFCDVCGKPYEKRRINEHFELHYYKDKRKKKPIPQESFIEVPRKWYERQMLLSRTEFEHELEFQRQKVFKFDRFFSV